MEKLVKRAIKGDKDAFVELMRANKASIYKTAFAILENDDDCADAIQDTYLAVFRNIHKLKKPQYFKTWLTRILINKCYDIRKRRKEYTELELISDRGEPDSNIENLSEDILEALSENYSLVLSLYYISGFSVTEIAKLLKLNENTVKTRLSRGREKLRKQYEEQNESYNGGKTRYEKHR